MNISQIMRQPAVVIHEDTSLEEAARIMMEHKLRGLPVVDELGKLCGFLSVSDYLAKDKYIPFSRFHAPQLFGKWISSEGIEQMYEEARTTPVKEIMSKNVIFVTEEDSVDKLVRLMLDRDLNRIPVVRDAVPVGIVARYDLLQLMLQKSGPE